MLVLLDAEEGVGILEVEVVSEVGKMLIKQLWNAIIVTSSGTFNGNVRKRWQILQKVRQRVKNTCY